MLAPVLHPPLTLPLVPFSASKQFSKGGKYESISMTVQLQYPALYLGILQLLINLLPSFSSASVLLILLGISQLMKIHIQNESMKKVTSVWVNLFGRNYCYVPGSTPQGFFYILDCFSEQSHSRF